MEDAPRPHGPPGREPTQPVAAPPITVVTVVHDPGPWFEDVLDSFVAQDYPRINFFFVDTGRNSSEERILDALPDASIVRLIGDPGFGKAANEILDGRLSPYLLICHDDVALDPDAVSRMLEESIRSNAGIVGPKLVDWDDPRVILQVGVGIDKTGAYAPHAVPGEFDQEQHDAVRDVFAIPGGAMLIRSDLFSALGGFDPGMSYRGEHIDLCWRAHVAGARVLIVPSSVVRHRQRLAERRPDEPANLTRRHQVRSVLSNYGRLHSIWVVPQALLLSLCTIVYMLAVGRVASASNVVSAWTWNFTNSGAILQRRRELAPLRKLGDSEVRSLQVRGFEVVNRFVRERAESGAANSGVIGTVATLVSSTQGRVLSAVWIGILGVMAFGSRHLLTDGVPVINGLGAFPDGPASLWSDWFSSYRSGALGYEGFAPTSMALLALAGNLLLGQMGLLRTVLTVGMIIIGAIGMARFTWSFESLGARALAPLVYVSIPLPYNALVTGSWDALALFAAAPWLLRGLSNAGDLRPFVGFERLTAWFRDIVALGLILALVSAFVPFAFVTLVLIGVAVVLGGLITGHPGRIDRLLLSLFGASAIAIILHLPWSTSFFSGDSTWARIGGARPTTLGELRLGELFRFETGPHGGAPLGWAVLAVAIFALVIARGERLIWSARAWMLILVGVGSAWVEQQDFLQFSLPRPEVLLVPAALGVAVAASMGVMSFEHDLRAYRFGWRQAVPALALVSLLAATFAGLGASFNGRWQAARGGLETASLFLADGREDAARVLWVGHDDALPAGGLRYDDNLAIATTRSRLPSVLDAHPTMRDDSVELVFSALDAALQGGTSRIGSYLAPLGIRYVVVIESVAPAPFSDEQLPVPAQVIGRLAEQLDLERIEVRDGLTVYLNRAWLPMISSFATDTVPTGPDAGPVLSFDVPDARRALPEARVPTAYSGKVAEDRQIYVASTATERWELKVDGVATLRSRAFGWANVFDVPNAGDAELRHVTPTRHRLLLLGQIALWIIATVIAVQPRVRRS